MHELKPLNIDELEFIQRRYRTESKIYMRGMNGFLVLGTLAPLAFCIFMIFLNGNAEMPLSELYHMFFVGLLFMMLFVGMIAVVSYREKLLDYHKDRTNKQKVIEYTNVKQKKYMKLNNTYHFYLSTPNKYTIEVSPTDFAKWQLGDEISIEYAQYSKEYFGYF